MTRIRIIAATLVGFLVAVESVCGQVRPTPADPPFEIGPRVMGALGRRMDRLVSAAEAFGFSGQVLVEVGGEIALHKAYGLADPANRRSMRLETPVGIASISKQFAAAAVLELDEQGRLSLHDSLHTFFDRVPEDKRGITLQHLITHTSGVRSRYSDDFEPPTLDELIRGILDTRTAFAPGARWGYSAAGYNLLAAVVQRVTAMPYEEAVRRLILEPSGMTSTGFLSVLPDGAPPPAHAHLAWDDRGSPTDWPRNWRNFGAGDMVSTAGDLYRWEVALRDGRVLSSGARDRFSQPLAGIGDGDSYGFGLFHHIPPSGPRVIEHGGDAALGFNGSFFRYPDEGFVIVITCTARTPAGQYLRHAIGVELETLARGGEPRWITPAELPSPEAVRGLPGTYRLDGGGTLHVLTDGAHLWIAAGDGAAAALLGGYNSEITADANRADDKTRALLAGLIAADSTAYRAALTDGGVQHFPSYWSDWSGLVASRGPFRDFHILGSRPLRDDMATQARLRFSRGSVSMTYFWSDHARGRLVGTFVGGADFSPAVALPLAAEPERAASGGLVTHDLFGGTTFRVTVRQPGRDVAAQLVLHLERGDVIATQTGAVGWVPPMR